MKRIAILLAAVGMGSGCIVSSPCDRTLTVDWSFINLAGGSAPLCSDVGVATVDVYVDGALVAGAVPCTYYGLTTGVSSGSHIVMVEGFSGTNVIINRDWFAADTSNCGDNLFHAAPGEGTTYIHPTNCSVPADYLTYELKDVTRAPYVISAIYPNSASLGTYSCGSGISFAVPYGNYDLTAIEETNTNATVVYASKCTATVADVLTFGTTTTNVAFTGTAACF